MKTIKIIATVIIGISIAFLGELLAYHVFANYNQGGWINGFLGITAFIAIFGGVILTIAYPISLAGKAEAYFNKKGNFINFLAGTSAFLFMTAPFVIATVTFYHFTGKYHDEQLEQFGMVTTVRIESEITGENSRHDLCFRFKHHGKTWKGMLDFWHYQVGDSVEVIFSSENPNETEWYQKYLEDTRSEVFLDSPK